MIIDLCDEEGLLVYEEPSGYRCEPAQDEAVKTWRREKLRRMILRERSHPSFVIYNLANEAQKPPSEDDIANVRMVQALDPGRTLTYTSHISNARNYWENRTPDPSKLHVLPFDRTHYTAGWFDHHHWFRYPGYVDICYRNPRFFARGVISGPTDIVPADSLHALPRNEIIFWGEEGQWGTMMRLEKIRADIFRTGADGWREKMLLSWYDRYDAFLDEAGFRSSFPTVDDLTLSMGRSLHYYHGRMLENARMGNLSDGFNLNGWAAPETSEDIADVYRYPTANPDILSYYAKPLYIAVKIPDKVLQTGMSPRADFFIVNELDVKGKHTLEVACADPGGVTVYAKSFPVNILGGEEYGQLLVEGVELPRRNALDTMPFPPRCVIRREIRSPPAMMTAISWTSGLVRPFGEQPRSSTPRARSIPSSERRGESCCRHSTHRNRTWTSSLSERTISGLSPLHTRAVISMPSSTASRTGPVS